jgi:hypothetical protein
VKAKLDMLCHFALMIAKRHLQMPSPLPVAAHEANWRALQATPTKTLH